MPTEKKITMEEIIAQYADNVITFTDFEDKAFIAKHKSKSLHVLLADKVIEKDLIYLVFEDKKIKHNISFLSDHLQKMVTQHQNDTKNGYFDWFVIGTWICLIPKSKMAKKIMGCNSLNTPWIWIYCKKVNI